MKFCSILVHEMCRKFLNFLKNDSSMKCSRLIDYPSHDGIPKICFMFQWITTMASYTYLKKKTDTLRRKTSACILQYIYNTAYKRFAKLSGKGSSIIQAQYPRPLYVPRGWKTLQTHGFPIQTYGKHSREHISYLKVKIKIPLIQNSGFCSFCMHI